MQKGLSSTDGHIMPLFAGYMQKSPISPVFVCKSLMMERVHISSGIRMNTVCGICGVKPPVQDKIQTESLAKVIFFKEIARVLVGRR